MRIRADVEGAAHPRLRAVFRDGLRHGQDVRLVEALSGRGPTMPGRPEGDELSPVVGIGGEGIVIADQPGNVDYLARWSGYGVRYGVHGNDLPHRRTFLSDKLPY